MPTVLAVDAGFLIPSRRLGIFDKGGYFVQHIRSS